MSKTSESGIIATNGLQDIQILSKLETEKVSNQGENLQTKNPELPRKKMSLLTRLSILKVAKKKAQEQAQEKGMLDAS